MFTTRAIFAGCAATVLFVLSQQPSSAQQLKVVLKANFFGNGATAAGVTVGDTIGLDATVQGLPSGRFPPSWSLQIIQTGPTRRTLVTCAPNPYPCSARDASNNPGSRTYGAVLYRGGQPPIPSGPINVVWAARTPTQLILEVYDRRVAVNYTFANLDAPGGVRRDSTIWTPVAGADPSRPLNNMATPTGPTWTAAVNWTSAVHARTPVQVHAYFNAPLPEPWHLFVCVNGMCDHSICGPQQLRCDPVIPHPATPGSGCLVGAFLYRDRNFADRVDINIQWVLP